MSIPIPPELKSKFIVVAFIVAEPGKAEVLQGLLSTVRRDSNSDKQPNTLTFRTTRGVGAESHNFTLFEEYADKKAFEDHLSSDSFVALQKSGTIAALTLEYREEFH